MGDRRSESGKHADVTDDQRLKYDGDVGLGREHVWE